MYAKARLLAGFLFLTAMLSGCASLVLQTHFLTEQQRGDLATAIGGDLVRREGVGRIISTGPGPSDHPVPGNIPNTAHCGCQRSDVSRQLLTNSGRKRSISGSIHGPDQYATIVAPDSRQPRGAGLLSGGAKALL